MSSLIERLNLKGERRLPVIQQTEGAECGLACVAMIACFYGRETNLFQLRQMHRVSLKGSTLKGITQLAAKVKLSHRAIKCDVSSIDQLKTPCILHWNLDHFVVLKKVSKGKYLLHDPAQGERWCSSCEMSQSFTGVALELTPQADFEEKKAIPQAKLFGFLEGFVGWKKPLVTVLLLSLMLQAFILAMPIYMQLTVDSVIITNDYSLLNVLAVGFAAVVLLNVICTGLRSLVLMLIGNQISLQMNSSLVGHLFRLPMDYFEKRHIGDVVSRFRSLEALKNLLTTTLIESLVDGLVIIGLLVMMYLYSVTLLVVVVVAAALYLVVRTSMYQRLKNVNRENIICNAKKDSNLMESVRAIQSVKLYSKESDRLNLFNNHNVDAANTSIKVERLKVLFNWSNLCIFGLENIAVVYIGADMVMSNMLTVGMLLAFVSYKTQFEMKVKNLIDKFIEFKMASLHLERLGDITLNKTEEDVGEEDDNIQVDGNLSLENVTFSYSDEDSDVISDVSFSIKQGESVAITGPSGCGKSTLMKLMLGLLKPTKGKILIDGKDIRSIGLVNYRKHVASVLQNDQLLSGTILENICFFSQDPDYQWAQECAKLAGVHRTIESFPMGYRSLIGDMGSTLSGGQVQRILLARALYRRPKLLLLDEATSSLDLAAEQHVNRAVRSLNITRVIIAHRPQTIMSADRIIQLGKDICEEVDKEEYTRTRFGNLRQVSSQ